MNRLSGVRRRCVRAFALIVIAVLAAVTATAATFAGSGVGLIPDGGNLPCSSSPGAPLNVTFAVSAMASNALTDIRVSVTFAGAHPWAGDLTAKLISPTGVNFPLFGRIGATATTGTGTRSAVSGTYVFVDPAISTNNIWAAASAANGGVIAPGTYATTPVGGGGASYRPAPTNFLAAFSALNTAAQLNGTWTLQMVDQCADDTASVSAAVLTLEQGALPTQYAFAPTVLDFGTLPLKTSGLANVVVYAPASNAQAINFNGIHPVCEVPFSVDFKLLTSFLSVAPGQAGELVIEYKPGRTGGPAETSASFYCATADSAQDSMVVILKGQGGTPPPPENCYDVDGDGVINPLVDGLFIVRLQLGLSAQAAANGISFRSPRSTAKKVIGYMTEHCGAPQ